MTQFGLFDAPLALVDGERGRVTYYDRFVPADEAEAAFAALRGGVDWHANRRVMYEREVDVPRLTAHFALAKLVAREVEGIDANGASAVAGLAARVSEALAKPFNSIGLNFYRDGNDSVAPHHDKLHDLVVGEPVALLSLGATRRMAIRPQAKDSAERGIAVDLVAGSLLVMSYSSQLHYLHGIAKTRVAVGPRISLALRVRPQ